MNVPWQAFLDEIARSRDDGRTAEFWWRDDDAARPDPALSRLIALAQRTATPLALAAIPARFAKEALEGPASGVTVLQHGTDHVNRAGPGGKKTEFDAGEAPAAAIARLVDARRLLEAQASKRFLPVLAPPWNRIPEQLAAHLAAAGFIGLSRYGVRRNAEAGPGLRQVNTHVDIIAWRTGGGFIGENEALAAATRHLVAKRSAAADSAEATGWLTHHAVHDDAAWAFLERLFETTRERHGAAWRSAEELFHTP
ncbi:MAG: hypothetical protein ABI654_00500 [Betaproteobacteria bacterium]